MNSPELLDELGDMAKVGAWEVNLLAGTIAWSKQVRNIHEVPDDYIPNFEKAFNFYNEVDKKILTEHFYSAYHNSTQFDLSLHITTFNGRNIWVRAIGKPMKNEAGETIGVRGVFQDIDQQKNEQNKLESTLAIAGEQNKRLLNFAHIVSHNLRSHTANFQSLLELLRITTDVTERHIYIQNLHKVSESLNQTIADLNQVVQIQTETKNAKTTLSFSDVWKQVDAVVGTSATDADARISTDFQVAQIQYVPAYLESILLNLVTNALKYKSPERRCEITISTTKNELNQTVLTVKDNGLGMDLQYVRPYLFGMYKTFHGNSNAKGIGLFITKNQVEAMGGSIIVESTVDGGTTMRVIFATNN